MDGEDLLPVFHKIGLSINDSNALLRSDARGEAIELTLVEE